MHQFEIHSLLEAEPGASLESIHQSQTAFCVTNIKSFQIMPDGKSVMGVEDTQEELPGTIAIENLSDNTKPVSKFKTGKKIIFSIIPNEFFTSVIVGDSDHQCEQYDFDASSGKWESVKDYGYMNINFTSNSASFKNLVIFALNGREITIINTKAKQKHFNYYKIDLESILSMQLCRVSETKTLLSMVGLKNSKDQSFGLIDFTEVLQCYYGERPFVGIWKKLDLLDKALYFTRNGY
jgi:hypothetical protein